MGCKEGGGGGRKEEGEGREGIERPVTNSVEEIEGKRNAKRLSGSPGGAENRGAKP